jgi:hypothetical protein
MLPIQRSLTKSIPLVQRSFASLSVEQFGALKYVNKAFVFCIALISMLLY